MHTFDSLAAFQSHCITVITLSLCTLLLVLALQDEYDRLADEYEDREICFSSTLVAVLWSSSGISSSMSSFLTLMLLPLVSFSTGNHPTLGPTAPIS